MALWPFHTGLFYENLKNVGLIPRSGTVNLFGRLKNLVFMSQILIIYCSIDFYS